MTDQHPLTDEDWILDPSEWEFVRAAYDKGHDKGQSDMLEQVIEWLQANLGIYDDGLGYCYITEDFLSDKVIDEDKLIDDLKAAMRPQGDHD